MYGDKKMAHSDAGMHQMDEETKMIMRQLNNLHENACDLLEHFKECAEPHLKESWVKKKIILATDYVDSVRDYVMSSHDKKMHSDKSAPFLVMVERRMEE
tara:strand:+ start:52 stop:351 length:300 start_codon:yes stop_codon:yes gene_type:complete